MPSKGDKKSRKSDKGDGGSKTKRMKTSDGGRRSPLASQIDLPSIHRKKKQSNNINETQRHAPKKSKSKETIKSTAADSLATVAVPKKPNKSKKDSSAKKDSSNKDDKQEAKSMESSSNKKDFSRNSLFNIPSDTTEASKPEPEESSVGSVSKTPIEDALRRLRKMAPLAVNNSDESSSEDSPSIESQSNTEKVVKTIETAKLLSPPAGMQISAKQSNAEKQEQASVSPKSNDNKEADISSATSIVGTKPDESKIEIAGKEANGEKKEKSLKIVTSAIKDSSHSETANKTKEAKSPRPPSTMDKHPYARASVIEVLHGVEDQTSEDDDWWSEDSDDDLAEAVEEQKSGQSVRLCDIIDRVSVGEQKWRYYVHYKDFNRRMDEWISMERIISPPSVGNAKARAIKKEEEKEKRKKHRLEEKKKEEAIDVSAPRASRRRSIVTQQQQQQLSADTSALAGADGESDTPRRTRLQRKKSVDDDTIIPSSQNEKSATPTDTSSTEAPAVLMAAEKGIVALPTTAATHSTTVGEHVVQTIQAQELDEHEGLDDAALREHEEVTKVKNVAFLELGAFQMETWYFSPLPKELLSEKGFTEVLYVCEFTFGMFARKNELQRFQARLPSHARHPPGNEIYRNGNLSMFEVDGFEERIYCQNLCYIAKLFLDHKTLYFDVDPFLFYVLCEVDERGFHPVGYYSKEKYSDVGYNLACILTFPCHQRKGYGRFLIAFSYELTKKEEKVGSPEKPMSDLGQQAYKPYWASTIVDFLSNKVPNVSSMSIMDISKMTSIMAEDIVFTLNQLGVLKIINGIYFIAAEEGLLKTLAKKYPVKEPRVDPSKLHWTPFTTDVKRDKFSVYAKKPNLDTETRGSGGFP